MMTKSKEKLTVALGIATVVITFVVVSFLGTWMFPGKLPKPEPVTIEAVATGKVVQVFSDCVEVRLNDGKKTLVDGGEKFAVGERVILRAKSHYTLRWKDEYPCSANCNWTDRSCIWSSRSSFNFKRTRFRCILGSWR